MANISMEGAEALRKTWEEKVKANPTLTCDHPKTRLKERYPDGRDNGDRVCPICGNTVYHTLLK